jgi:hypothetical protein
VDGYRRGSSGQMFSCLGMSAAALRLGRPLHHQSQEDGSGVVTKMALALVLGSFTILI